MMANNLHSVILRGSIFLLMCIICLPETLVAQRWNRVDSLRFNDEILAVSMDLTGNLYVADAGGKITKYDESLAKVASSSKARFNTISSVDAIQILKVFVFYQTTQQYQFLDRFLTPLQPALNIESDSFAQYSAATLSADQMIWLVNEDRLRLQKYNPILQEVIIDTDLSYFLTGDEQVKTLQEHNNRLYLHHQQEILMFDSMGNFISKLPLEFDQPFSLYRERLYYIEEGRLLRYHLDTMETEVVDIVLPKEVRFILSGDNVHFFFTSQKIIAYR